MRSIKMFCLMLTFALTATMMLSTAEVKAEADTPQWEVGDEWSMGSSIDFEETLGPQLDALSTLAVTMGEMDEFDLDLKGDFSTYHTSQVTEVGDTQYTMSIRSGTSLFLDASLSMSTEMTKEGTYRYDSWDFEPPTEIKDVSLDVYADISVGITGEAIYSKADLALQEMDLVMTLKGEVDFEMINFPEEDYDWDPDTYEDILTVEYVDYDISGSADVKFTLDMEFTPGLDIFDFPIQEGETWDVESQMTVSGTYEGTIDGEGIPEELISEMEYADLVLPLVLEDIDTGLDEMNYGVLQEQTVPVSFSMMCSGTDTIELEDGSETEAYIIQMEQEYDEYDYSDYYYMTQPEDDESDLEEDDDYYYPIEDYEEESYFSPFGFMDMSQDMEMLYSPDEGFFVSMQMGGMEELDMIMGSSSDSGLFAMQPVSRDDAEEKLETIEAGREAGDEKDDGFSPLIFILVGVALFLIVVVLLAVIILITVMRKRSKREQQEEVLASPRE